MPSGDLSYRARLLSNRRDPRLRRLIAAAGAA